MSIKMAERKKSDLEETIAMCYVKYWQDFGLGRSLS